MSIVDVLHQTSRLIWKSAISNQRTCPVIPIPVSSAMECALLYQGNNVCGCVVIIVHSTKPKPFRRGGKVSRKRGRLKTNRRWHSVVVRCYLEEILYPCCNFHTVVLALPLFHGSDQCIGYQTSFYKWHSVHPV